MPSTPTVTPTRQRPHPGAILGLLALATLLGAPSADAHVESTTAEGEAGRRAELGFVPTHGCSGAPTIGIDIQIPDEVVDPLPVALDGWTTRVEGGVVTWDGGPLPDGDEETFVVDVLLPDAPGTTLYFPTIQRCEGGASLSWVQRPDDGSDQSYPAPSMAVVEATGPPGTVSPTTTIPTTEPRPVTTTAPPATSPSTTAPPTTTIPTAVLLDDESSTSNSWLVPALVAAGIGLAALAAGVYAVRRKRTE